MQHLPGYCLRILFLVNLTMFVGLLTKCAYCDAWAA